MICPKCKANVTLVFDEVEKVMVCPSCGYKFNADIDEKRNKLKDRKIDNVEQGSKFSLVGFEK